VDFLTTNGAAILFYLFAAIALISAFVVVTQRNPMFGAIALLVSFLSIAALFVLRNAEFLAAVQIFVYGGGIMVLFLFVIMLVNLHKLNETRTFLGQAPMAVVLGILLIGLFGFILWSAHFGSPPAGSDQLVSVDGEVMGNTQAVAWLLYREYLLPFEIASVFLLVAMIGAVVLGRRD